jgi:DNA topoisomerase III
MDFIITEKPSVAADFAKALKANKKEDGAYRGNGYVITWSFGHLVALCEPEDYDPKWKRWSIDTLPIAVDQIKYKLIDQPSYKQRFKEIKTVLKGKFDRYIIATDAGREGEVIARTILLQAGFKDFKKLYRFWSSSALTPEVIGAEIKKISPASKYDSLWQSGQSRQIADWLFGMNGSRAITLSMGGEVFPVGRVQTSVLALLVNRKAEIENFKAETYWVLKADFKGRKALWSGVWEPQDKSLTRNQVQVRELAAKIKDKTGIVDAVTEKKKNEPPPLLYSLTNLQQDCNRMFGFTADQTLKIAQKLYEQDKCISYPRTSSNFLGEENFNMIETIIQKLSQPELRKGIDEKHFSVKNKRVFNDAKLSDHHALIPLKDFSGKNADDAKVYNLILKRFFAVFYPDDIYTQRQIKTVVEKELFVTNEKVLIKQGWSHVYKAESISGTLTTLPTQGESAHVENVLLEEKETQPPFHYNEATLLADMKNPNRYVEEDEYKLALKLKNLGLGTEATRSGIIEKLMVYRYAQRNKKQIIATDKGCALVNYLSQNDVTVRATQVNETAKWETTLNLIEEGQANSSQFLQEITSYVNSFVTAVRIAAPKQEYRSNQNTPNNTSQKSMGTCLKCKGDIVEREKFYGCANWKNNNCNFKVWKTIAGKKITPQILKVILSKKKTEKLKGFKSKAGKAFDARLAYDTNKGEIKMEFE